MAFLVKTYQPFDDIVLLMALPRYEFRSVSAGFTSGRPVEPPWEGFGDRGKGPGPDVCVLRGVRDPARRRGSFWVGREPGELVLVIEIVSRRYRKKDYKDSKAVYQREKVPELILIELQGEYLDGPYKLSGFKLDDKGVYQEMSVDEGGGLVSEETGVRLAKDPQGWGLEVTDLHKGQRLLTPEEVAALAEQEAARAEREAERAKREAERAKQEATRAEQEATRAEQEAARAEQEATRAEQEAARAEQEAARAEQEATRAEQEATRAEQEATRAEQEATRAEQEAARAEQEAARAEREAAARRALEEELARLKRSMT